MLGAALTTGGECITRPNRGASLPDRGQDRRSILLFLVLALGYCRGALGSTGVYYFGDISRAHLAFHAAIARQVRSGHWPLWTDQIFGGMPLLAEGQAGVYYPPNALFYLPWISIHTALKISVCLHFFLAACFCYYLARKLGQGPWGARFSAISFGFSGYLAARLIHQNVFHAVVWLPLVLGLVAAAQACTEPRARRRHLLLGSLALGIQALTFYPPVTFYTLLAVGLFCLAQPARPSGAAVGWSRRVLDLLLVSVPGLFVAAGQIVPSLELLRLSPRGDMGGFGYVTQMSFPFKHVPALFFPNFFGSPAEDDYWGAPNSWELCGYVGILPPLLLLPALAGRPRPRPARFFILLAALGLFMALGSANPLFRLLPYLPGFNLFKAPARYLIFTALGLAVAGGFGLEALVAAFRPTGPGSGDGSGRLAWATGRLAFGLGACSALAALAVVGLQAELEGLARRRILPSLLGAEGRERPESYYLEQFRVRWEAYYWGRVSDLLFTAAVLLGAALLIRLAVRGLARGRPLPAWLPAGVVAFAVLDLFRFGSGMQPLIDPAFFTAPPAVVRAIRADTGAGYRDWRAASGWTGEWEKRVRAGHPGWKGSKAFEFRLREALPWNLNLFDPGGLRLLEGGTAVPPEGSAGLDRLDPAAAVRFLQARNVRYLVSARPLADPGLVPLATFEGLTLYRLAGARPRASLAVSPNSGPTWMAPGAEGARVVESSPANPGRIGVETTTLAPRVLVLSDRPYPGWECGVDGRPAPLTAAGGNGLAVWVPAGSHRVLFRFRSPSARLGGWISLISLALVAAALYGSRGRPAAGDDSGSRPPAGAATVRPAAAPSD